jgi:MFS family permease
MYHKVAMTTTTNRRSLIILSFTLVVVMLGFGLVIPIFPFFVEDLGAGGRELGLLVATSALLEFVFAPMWGGISDRIGRKPILMIGVVCPRPPWLLPSPMLATPRRKTTGAKEWAILERPWPWALF